jgi:hypothetical protein
VQKIELLIDRQLTDGRFVVVNTSKVSVPVGTVFAQLQSRLAIREGESFREEEVAMPEPVLLEVVEVEFFRNPVDEVPYGHNAAVRLAGEGIEKVLQQLTRRTKSVFVYLSSGQATAQVQIQGQSHA